MLQEIVDLRERQEGMAFKKDLDQLFEQLQTMIDKVTK